jgi:dTDP-3-amino-3,4,6-trideoxy-alpha-D-glucose transaminase
MAIPLTRLDNGEPELTEEILEVVARIARSGAFVGGAEVAAFEAELSDYCDVRHAVGVSSGTDALALTLRALDVGPGDEVVVPANSFIATAEAVTLVGATPRFADVDPRTALVTADHVAAAITERTRCIIPVHLYGRTVDLDPILRLARRCDATVIEDACQAHGAWLNGRRAGSVADAGCFSFYPAKNLGAWGDAGAVVTDDAAIADRVRLVQSHGERPRYRHRVPGTTARLDAIQAGVLRVKLRRLDAWNERRRDLGARLTECLRGTAVRTPAPAGPGADHVFHQYVVTSPERDALREHLAARNVATSIHYPVPIHRSEAYEALGYAAGSLPVSEELALRSCSLPMHPGLSYADVEEIAAAIREFGVPQEAAA